MKLNLSKFKKVHQDKDKAIMESEDGHQMHIALKALSPKNREEIHKMAMHKKPAKMAEGGEVEEQPIPLNLENPQLPDSMINPTPGSQAMAQNLPIQQSSMPSPDDMPYGVKPEDMASKMPQEAPMASAAPSPLAEPQKAPISQPGMPNPQLESKIQQGNMLDQATNMELQGISGAAKAEAAIQQRQAIAADHAAAAQKMFADNLNKSVTTHTAEIDAVAKDMVNGHIDPHHYLSSMGTSQKIATGIGLILGGIGSGLTGQPNMALDFLNKQIDRDIEGQRLEMDKKNNLVSIYSKMMGNERDGAAMASQIMARATADKMMADAAKSGSPLAMARAQKEAGALLASRAPQLAQLNMSQALAKTIKAGQKQSVDPAYYVPLLVPADKQKEVFAEIQRAQNTRHMGKNILEAFDQAAKDNTVLKTGAGMLRTPASVYALHQHMQPTFGDLEGTVRQSAMDNTFNNITPRPGDLDSTIATERKALQEYIQSKASAPMAKGFGIDLSQFQSTNPVVGEQAKSHPMEGKTASNAKGEKLIFSGGKWQPIK